MQQWLNKCKASLGHADPAAVWRSKLRFHPSTEVAQDLKVIESFITSPSASHAWTRPIGLLIPRSPYVLAYTDASYEGLGGWSTKLRFQWRLSSADLFHAGLPVLTSEPPRYAPFPPGKLHINVLEFYAVLINTWIMIRLISSRVTPPGGFILHCLADNTSALAWMAKASRSRRPIVQRAARAYAALLTFASSQPFRVQSSHIPGHLNVAADALSRPQQYPTWSLCSKEAPDLKGLTRFLLPQGLLSFLRSTALGTPTEDTLETQIRKLLSLELVTLSPGARHADSKTSASFTHPRRMRGTSSRRTHKQSRKEAA